MRAEKKQDLNSRSFPGSGELFLPPLRHISRCYHHSGNQILVLKKRSTLFNRFVKTINSELSYADAKR
ncbi:MAG: hypothetical protein NZ959_01240 [Armatimonadetes bacterium]|nr:hypothetical protein [Armatimonadota bacterium]MDW8121862.1 hypothetical protein [Armatimonadota bacterium]